MGEVDILRKKPLFHQDFKHILDYLRLEAPAALQSSSLQHTNSTIDTLHIVSCLKYCKLKKFYADTKNPCPSQDFFPSPSTVK